MTRVDVREPSLPSTAPPRRRTFTVLAAIALLQITVLACDPVGLVLAAPLLLLLIVGAAGFLVAVLTSAAEIAALARDGRTRVIHGLEHACTTLLQRGNHAVLAGQTHPGYFELHVVHDGRLTSDAIRRTTQQAIARLSAGDARLALHPRCGTSLLLGGTLVSLFIVVGALVALLAGVAPRAVTACTMATVLVVFLALRPLGLLAQRLLTVSSHFASATVGRTSRFIDASGYRVTFVVEVDVHLTHLAALEAALAFPTASSEIAYLHDPADSFSDCPSLAPVTDADRQPVTDGLLCTPYPVPSISVWSGGSFQPEHGRPGRPRVDGSLSQLRQSWRRAL